MTAAAGSGSGDGGGGGRNDERIITVGRTSSIFCDNGVRTSKYTFLSFLPVAVGEQFRRKGNVYFLVMGLIMAIGWYSPYFDSAISPYTTLGPLALVISISLLQEGIADLARHRSDYTTNSTPCIVVERGSKELLEQEEEMRKRGREKEKKHKDERVLFVHPQQPPDANGGGGDVESGLVSDMKQRQQQLSTAIPIEFHAIQRRHIRAGHLVFLRNRDMIPADLVLLASSGDNGGAYIETSSIDGETNLKLRTAARPTRDQEQSKMGGASVGGALATIASVGTGSVESGSTSGVDGSSGGVGVGYGKSFGFDGKYIAEEEGVGVRNSVSFEDASLSPRTVNSADSDGPSSPNNDGGSAAASSSSAASPASGGSGKRSSLKDTSKYSSPTSASGGEGSPEEAAPPSGGIDPLSQSLHGKVETLEEAVARITSFTVLGSPRGLNPLMLMEGTAAQEGRSGEEAAANPGSPTRRLNGLKSPSNRRRSGFVEDGRGEGGPKEYITMLTSELPNASVNTFGGKLTLPPVEDGGRPLEVPLSADNFLLRGAYLRNTEWAIGVACFTGKDTKLVKNSSSPPSRLSQLDKLVNRTIMIIITVMIIFVLALSLISEYVSRTTFSTTWYLGYSKSQSTPWPYLQDLPPPEWVEAPFNLIQNLLLFVTLLNNFVPLSLYVTMEVTVRAMMLFINGDVNMYHPDNDTPANARSTTVTDLGQIKYVFSDKTGTLTQNVMRFKRCSVDGLVFGAPIIKKSPGAGGGGGGADDTVIPEKAFHPIRKLLVGAGIKFPDGSKNRTNFMGTPKTSPNLTFNAEMFLRVMSICHTVVVEKDYDGEDDGSDNQSDNSDWLTGTFTSIGSKFKKKGGPGEAPGRLSSIREHNGRDEVDGGGGGVVVTSTDNGGADGDDLDMSQMTDGGMSSAAYDPPPSAFNMGMNTNMNDSQHDTNSVSSSVALAPRSDRMSRDGAPIGRSYQAESPDEGALVSAASLIYGYQFLGKDSSGIRLSCSSPSILRHNCVSNGIKRGKFTEKSLALASISPDWEDFLTKNGGGGNDDDSAAVEDGGPREEVWQVLAVNKFDSTRKRMSVLVRSPPDLGSIFMLLCKGADSAMLDEDVCEFGGFQYEEPEPEASAVQKDGGTPTGGSPTGGFLKRMSEHLFGARSGEEKEEAGRYDAESYLSIQSHLGDFASEGLRTLVLGVKVMTEDDAQNWLLGYLAASNAIHKRDEKLTQSATEIETGLHIVGVTAIEDKLQKGVPDTISNLAKAGIKLWVLTGDKRETAIEIGYSTKVLTPEMSLFQVAADGGDGGRADVAATRIQTLVANQFMKLVKTGELVQYQHSRLNQKAKPTLKNRLRDCWKFFALWWGKLNHFFLWALCKAPCALFGMKSRSILMIDDSAVDDGEEEGGNKFIEDIVERRQQVRELAEQVLREHVKKHAPKRRTVTEDAGEPTELAGSPSLDQTVDGDSTPGIFGRAASAKALLAEKAKHDKGMSSMSYRSLSVASVVSKARSHDFMVDEDALSMMSFFPEDYGGGDKATDLKPRRMLEKLFCVDSDVRHGRLHKHHEKRQKLGAAVDLTAVKEEDARPLQHTEKLDIVMDDGGQNELDVLEEGRLGASNEDSAHTLSRGPRALIIEGHALQHLLGNPLMEEMLFAVASCCDAIIACRVSPKQKALLVRMVRTYVIPTPMTLAIGDGANDVGMIQEAHVGIGISGLEGQQAVNSSDFSIAQFRFLEELLLVHGRWNFTRMARVVLFSFYKNAVLAGQLIMFNGDSLYSGQTLFDPWVISMFNFVCTIPILFVGLFDRDIEKDYVKKNPYLYAAGPHNEEMSLRKVYRWISITLIHIFTLYFTCNPTQSLGASETSAWKGLMFNKSREFPGNGEGSFDTYGLTIYFVLVVTLAYKALYETRSIITGEFRLFRCRKGTENCWSRVPWTFLAVTAGSIVFFIWAIYLYSFIAQQGNVESFMPFAGVAWHTLNTRSVTWMLVLLVPVAAQVFDVAIKVFANFYFPTQTQIHAEIALKDKHR